MKHLLRSCFVADKDDQPHLIRHNIIALAKSGITFDDIEDTVIWNYIQDFVRQHDHAPQVSTLLATFSARKEEEVGDRIEEIRSLPTKTGGDFTAWLTIKVDDRRKKEVSKLLQDAGTIVAVGLDIQEKGHPKTKIKGALEALQYVQDRGAVIAEGATSRGAVGAEMGLYAETAWRAYEATELDPSGAAGQYAGIKQFDDATKGCHRGELWVHAGYVGQGKSTFLHNWAYSQAILGGHSVALWSLEMPVPQVSRILYAIHSHHSKFGQLKIDLGLADTKTHQDIGLPTNGLRDGNLSPEQKKLYRAVCTDWAYGMQTGLYGRLYIEVPEMMSPKGYTVIDLRNRAEELHRTHELGLLVVDYGQKLASKQRYKNTTETQNEIAGDLKNLSVSFNRGEGIAVATAWQISREGWKAAVANAAKGEPRLYNETGLSYANEIERSADVVTAGFLDDELRKAGRIRMEILKARDSDRGDRGFLAKVNWPSRRMTSCDEEIALPPPKTEPKKSAKKLDDALGDALDKAFGGF